MASKYAIETIFNLIDNVSAPTGKVGKALDNLGIKSKSVSNALKKDFDKAADRVDRLGKSIKKAMGFLAAAGVAAVGAGLAVATKQFIEFDNALHKAGAVFSDLNPAADDFKIRLKSLGKEARNVAAVTEFNAQQTAGALATMAMAGIKSDQAVALLPKVADMATAAGLDLDKAAGMAADSLGVFGLMSDDPLKLADNFKYVSDVMVKTASLANMDLPLMYEAVVAGGKEFTKANQTIEDFGAAIDVLAANGYKGAEAGKAVNTMMIRLAAPSKKGQDALNNLGIATRDTRGNLLNFVDIIGQFENKMKGMGTAEQAQYMDAIFGKQQYSKASALIASGAEALRGYSDELKNAGGATEQMAGVMRGSLQNRIEVLKSSLMELGFKFVDAFAEKGGAAIGKITDAINNFDITPIIGAAEAAANAIAGFARILFGAVKLAWQFRYLIIAIVAPLIAYQVALMAVTIATRAFHKIQTMVKLAMFVGTLVTKGQTAALAGLTVGTVAHSIATKAMAIANGIATAAQWALNAAMAANPIGLIVMGIVAAIAAITALTILIVKNWERITNAFKKGSEKVMAVISIICMPIGLVISMIKEIASNWAKIKEALAATGLFDKIKEIAGAIKNFFKPAIDWLVNAFYTVKDAITGFFSNIGNKIKDFFTPALNAVSGFFSRIFNAIYNFVKPALDWFAAMWLKIVSIFKDNAIINAIKVIGGTLLSGILAPIQGLLEILSYIPGLGHLAGKGAEKIQEFRNFLKGVDGATVTAEVKPPENVTLTPPTDTGTQTLTSQDFSAPQFAIGGAAGKSKLHGVVDVSDGAAGYSIMNANGATSTASSAVSGSASSAVPEIIIRNISEMTYILRKIDTATRDIANSLTSTGSSINMPRVKMGGDTDEDSPSFSNPRSIAPITQADRMAYNVDERIQKLIIEVAAEKGTSARIVRAPRSAEIELTTSGGNT